MYFRFLVDDVTGCVSYLLGDLASGEAALIDPRSADMPVLNAMLGEQKLRLQWVLRTHAHGCESPLESPTLQDWGVPVLLQSATPSVLRLGNETLQWMPTPGHTVGCTSLLWRDRLFCGGSLSADACPVQAEPESPEALWDSVTRKIFTLPGETLLFGAHTGSHPLVSTVQEQRRSHPWFANASRDEFLSRFAPLKGVKIHPTSSIR